MVTADDRQSFADSLGNNQPIKRVSVMQGEVQQPGEMVWTYLEQLDLVFSSF